MPILTFREGGGKPWGLIPIPMPFPVPLSFPGFGKGLGWRIEAKDGGWRHRNRRR
jgi:hypothetical protein